MSNKNVTILQTEQTTISTLNTTSRQQNLKSKKSYQKEPITYYELLELEKEKNEPEAVKVKIKRNFPIAPDGFIPNSVVKKFFQIFEPGPKPEKKIWKLKWKPPEALKELEIEEDSLEVDNNERQEFYLDITSDEEEKIENNTESKNSRTLSANEKSTEYEDPEKALNNLIKKLKTYDWFKISNDLTIDNIITYLINKLIERDQSNHADLTDILKEVKKKFKINSELMKWIRVELEEELDATDPDILANSISLISDYCLETYKIDNQLLNILYQPNYQQELKSSALETLRNLTDLDKSQIEISLQNYKRFQNSKYKKLEKFRLKNFVQEIEKENEAELAKLNQVYNVDDESSSETFKQILKEDWIPDAVKNGLKTLKDFLKYILKSLKTVKSKIFYDKLCQYLKTLYDEFKLGTTKWEKEIVTNFINTNQDVKVADQLRVIDIENLGKYYLSSQDQDLKNEILNEFLRSAMFEKNRPLVMETSKDLLKKFTNISNPDLDELIQFCNEKNFKLSWKDALLFYKTKPDLTLDDYENIKGNKISLWENQRKRNADDNKTANTNKNKKKKETKKEKEKSKTKKTKEREKSKDKETKETKIKKEQKIKIKTETIKENIEPDNNTNLNNNNQENLITEILEDKKSNQEELELKQIENELKNDEITTNRSSLDQIKNNDIKNEPKKSVRINLDKIESNESNSKKSSLNSFNRGKTSLLPNNTKGWDYYQKRTDFEREKTNLTDDYIKTNTIYSLDQNLPTTISREITTISIYDENTLDTIKTELYVNKNDLKENNAEFKTTKSEYLNYDIEISTHDDAMNDLGDNMHRLDILLDKFDRSKTLDDLVKSRHKDSKEILNGITKRVILNETPANSSANNREFLKRYNTLLSTNTEKAHFIEPLDFKNSIDQNFKFRSMQMNKKLKETEFNQLLECLIVRGLDLHKHYEKLLPVTDRRNETFVPIPYFKDFLIVHPYNPKNSLKQFTCLDLKNRTNQSSEENDNSNASDNFNLNFPVHSSTNNLYPIRRLKKRANTFYRSNLNEARVGDFELNHIFLINKLLISYDAQNMRNLYSTLNSNFQNYLNRLHTRIPHRIVPLIWNDPVIQKLAVVISSSDKFKKKANEPRVDVRRRENVKRNYFNNNNNNQNQYLNASDNFIEGKKLPVIRKSNTVTNKEMYGQWPLFKTDDTPQNRVVKKKLYHHLMGLKHDYIKLQWRFMLKDEKSNKPQTSFLPPLSFKAPLYYHENQ